VTGNSTYLSILILNINGLNAPVRRYRIANWIKKQTEPFFAYKKHISLRKTDTGLE
jgi:hypothetical protein